MDTQTEKGSKRKLSGDNAETVDKENMSLPCSQEDPTASPSANKKLKHVDTPRPRSSDRRRAIAATTTGQRAIGMFFKTSASAVTSVKPHLATHLLNCGKEPAGAGNPLKLLDSFECAVDTPTSAAAAAQQRLKRDPLKPTSSDDEPASPPAKQQRINAKPCNAAPTAIIVDDDDSPGVKMLAPPNKKPRVRKSRAKANSKVDSANQSTSVKGAAINAADNCSSAPASSISIELDSSADGRSGYSPLYHENHLASKVKCLDEHLPGPVGTMPKDVGSKETIDTCGERDISSETLMTNNNKNTVSKNPSSIATSKSTSSNNVVGASSSLTSAANATDANSSSVSPIVIVTDGEKSPSPDKNKPVLSPKQSQPSSTVHPEPTHTAEISNNSLTSIPLPVPIIASDINSTSPIAINISDDEKSPTSKGNTTKSNTECNVSKTTECKPCESTFSVVSKLKTQDQQKTTPTRKKKPKVISEAKRIESEMKKLAREKEKALRDQLKEQKKKLWEEELERRRIAKEMADALKLKNIEIRMKQAEEKSQRNKELHEKKLEKMKEMDLKKSLSNSGKKKAEEPCKEKQKLSNFFKTSTSSRELFKYDSALRFQKLQLKPFMSMSPIHRMQVLNKDQLVNFDEQLQKQECNSFYLQNSKNIKLICRRKLRDTSKKLHLNQCKMEDDVIIIEKEDSSVKPEKCENVSNTRIKEAIKDTKKVLPGDNASDSSVIAKSPAMEHQVSIAKSETCPVNTSSAKGSARQTSLTNGVTTLTLPSKVLAKVSPMNRRLLVDVAPHVLRPHVAFSRVFLDTNCYQLLVHRYFKDNGISANPCNADNNDPCGQATSVPRIPWSSAVDYGVYKLLQFAEDYRPPYHGTYRRKSKKVNGRRPFARDSSLDYEFDSEAEWVEPEIEVNGESCLSGDDDAATAADEDDSNDDGFFVPAGYVSNEDLGEKKIDNKDCWGKTTNQSSNQPIEAIQPSTTGIVYMTNDLAYSSLFLRERIVLLTKSGNRPISFTAIKHSKCPKSSKKMRKRKVVPPVVLPALARMLHYNPLGIEKIITAFWQECIKVRVKQRAMYDDAMSVVDGKRRQLRSFDLSLTPVPTLHNFSKIQLKLMIKKLTIKVKTKKLRKNIILVKPKFMRKYDIKSKYNIYKDKRKSLREYIRKSLLPRSAKKVKVAVPKQNILTFFRRKVTFDTTDN